MQTALLVQLVSAAVIIGLLLLLLFRRPSATVSGNSDTLERLQIIKADVDRSDRVIREDGAHDLKSGSVFVGVVDTRDVFCAAEQEFALARTHASAYTVGVVVSSRGAPPCRPAYHSSSALCWLLPRTPGRRTVAARRPPCSVKR